MIALGDHSQIFIWRKKYLLKSIENSLENETTSMQIYFFLSYQYHINIINDNTRQAMECNEHRNITSLRPNNSLVNHLQCNEETKTCITHTKLPKSKTSFTLSKQFIDWFINSIAYLNHCITAIRDSTDCTKPTITSHHRSLTPSVVLD